ncbi:hypothetical protein J437_LFUL012257 [Ladona fulva]|uniref:Aminomethyltransferase, mitochondrial n=1 Tax=Ladona fulva TaxID=123851 RepID=A0A8K0KAE3_LADFU|nr:hypothetical protein J437_LFUL012257 [Ladona fulva]
MLTQLKFPRSKELATQQPGLITPTMLVRWASKQGHLIIRSVSTGSPNFSKKTCLYDFHVENGGKMVDFAGYLLPVNYSSLGIAASHVHTRTCCSLFDVSHMAQTKIYGKDRVSFIESLTTADIQGLGINQAQLSVLTNDNGGIIDDLIITNASETYLFVVSNASRREVVRNLFEGTLEKGGGKMDVRIEMAGDDKALLALQGPESARVLGPLLDVDFSKLTFMTSTEAKVAGVPDCRVSRLGYTGEDGVEISAPAEGARTIAEALLTSKNGNVKLAGLGARDSLRLEAGLCLYGMDMDEETTPVEASLAWLVRKRRRLEQGFPGAGIIVSQIKGGVNRKRVGLRSEGPPARHGTEVHDEEGTKIGVITSGCPSPSLGYNIAMAYVNSAFAKIYGFNRFISYRIVATYAACLVLHIAACTQFLTAVIRKYNNEKYQTWVNIDNLWDKSTIHSYIYALHRGTSLALGGNFLQTEAVTEGETVLAILTRVAGALTIAVFIGHCVHIISSAHRSKRESADKMKRQLQSYLADKRIPSKLKNKVFKYFDFHYPETYYEQSHVEKAISKSLLQMAIEPCETFCLNREDFMEVVHPDSALWQNIAAEAELRMERLERLEQQRWRAAFHGNVYEDDSDT